MKLSRKWVNLVLIALFAWMASGGSFTCYASNHDHDHPPPSNGK
jgi:hypothetical protein